MAKRKNKKEIYKHPVFIAVVAFILLFTILWPIYTKNYSSDKYQTSQTSEELSDWQTFTSTEQGIEFKYPSDWTAKQNEEWTFLLFLNYKPFELPTLGTDAFNTTISISYNEVRDTANGELRFENSDLENEINAFTAPDLKKENLMIGGKKAVKLTGTAGPGPAEGNQFVVTLVQLNGKVLTISLSDKNYEKIYDQILSTFKFTD